MASAQEVGAQFVDAFNAHDEERIRELSAENEVFEGPGVQVEGRDATTGYAMSWLNAFEDGRLEVHNELVAGDWVVQEFVFAGTHTGTLSGAGGRHPADEPAAPRPRDADPARRERPGRRHAALLRPGRRHDAARAHARGRAGDRLIGTGREGGDGCPPGWPTASAVR